MTMSAQLRYFKRKIVELEEEIRRLNKELKEERKKKDFPIPLTWKGYRKYNPYY